MSNKLLFVLDPGHGGTDRSNVGPTGFVEADGNLRKALYLREELESRYSNVKVLLTRETDTYVSLGDRGMMGMGAFLFLSIHSNGFKSSEVRGAEVYHSVDLPNDEGVAAQLSKVYADAYMTINRGAKTWESETDPGEDYLKVIDIAQDMGAQHVFLTEEMFHTNPHEEYLLKQDSSARMYAKLTCDIWEKNYPMVTAKVPDEYAEAWEKGVLAGIEDGLLPNEPVTAAKLMKYFDKMGLLDYYLHIQGKN